MKRRIIIGLTGLLLAGFLYAALRPLFDLPRLPGLDRMSTILLLLFSLCHAWYMLGWRHSLIFFALAAIISWGFEQVGVATGLIYGPYHYTAILGGRLGHVPFLIPLAWFMMIYPSYVLANLIAGDPPAGSRGTFARIAWLAFLSALIMTAWDVVMDPLMSGPTIQAWVWERGGAYFGVPAQNFVGWILTTFTIYLAYRLFERWKPGRPAGPATPEITALPWIAYAAMMVSTMSPSQPPAMLVIAPFVMGLPLAAAAGKMWNVKC